MILFLSTRLAEHTVSEKRTDVVLSFANPEALVTNAPDEFFQYVLFRHDMRPVLQGSDIAAVPYSQLPVHVPCSLIFGSSTSSAVDQLDDLGRTFGKVDLVLANQVAFLAGRNIIEVAYSPSYRTILSIISYLDSLGMLGQAYGKRDILGRVSFSELSDPTHLVNPFDKVGLLRFADGASFAAGNALIEQTRDLEGRL